MIDRLPVLFACVIGGCLVQPLVDPIACDDTDLDGLCDDEDDCPADAENDADADGVCGDVDLCATGADILDDDADGVPDACDACPGVPDEDEDDDGRCDAEDACLGDPQNLCATVLWVGLQTDLFWADDEATWRLRTASGTEVASGGFDEPAGGDLAEIVIDATVEHCIEVDDTFGDGGVRGLLFVADATSGRKLAEWGRDAYTDHLERCFDPLGGEAFTPPVKRVWLKGGSCEATLRVYSGQNPNEVGWRFATEEAREIDGRTTGSYVFYSQWDEIELDLVDGYYTFTALDAAGDGWTSDGDDARWELVSDKGQVLQSGALSSGYQGAATFPVTCP